MWRAHPGNLASDAWTDLRRTLDALLEAAHEAGVRLGIEPEPGNVVRDARTAARLLAELGHDAPAGIVLDPANLLTPETISRQSELLAEAVDLLGPRVVGIQAKDVAASGAAAAAGAGLLDSPVVLGQLARLPPVPLIVQDASEADAARVRADLLRWSARRGNSISSTSTGPTVPPCSVAPPSSHGGGLRDHPPRGDSPETAKQLPGRTAQRAHPPAPDLRRMVSASLWRVRGRARAPTGPPLGGLPALGDVDPLARHLAVAELEQLHPVLPGTAVVAGRDLDDGQVLTCRDPSDPVAHLGRVLAAPLREVGSTFESLTRLRELQHRVVVVELLRAVHVRAGVLPVAPHLVEHHRRFGHRTSCASAAVGGAGGGARTLMPLRAQRF